MHTSIDSGKPHDDDTWCSLHFVSGEFQIICTLGIVLTRQQLDCKVRWNRVKDLFNWNWLFSSTILKEDFSLALWVICFLVKIWNSHRMRAFITNQVFYAYEKLQFSQFLKLTLQGFARPDHLTYNNIGGSSMETEYPFLSFDNYF